MGNHSRTTKPPIQTTNWKEAENAWGTKGFGPLCFRRTTFEFRPALNNPMCFNNTIPKLTPRVPGLETFWEDHVGGTGSENRRIPKRGPAMMNCCLESLPGSQRERFVAHCREVRPPVRAASFAQRGAPVCGAKWVCFKM